MMLLFIGIGEIVDLVIFILVFFGVSGLKDSARAFGKFYRQMQDAFNEVKSEINSDISEKSNNSPNQNDKKKSTKNPAG